MRHRVPRGSQVIPELWLLDVAPASRHTSGASICRWLLVSWKSF